MNYILIKILIKMQVYNDNLDRYDPQNPLYIQWYNNLVLENREDVKILIRDHIKTKINDDYISLFLLNISIKTCIDDYLKHNGHFGTYEQFDNRIFFELTDITKHKYIKYKHNWYIISKFIYNWSMFLLYKPNGIRFNDVLRNFEENLKILK
jgi:hypothetical protein